MTGTQADASLYSRLGNIEARLETLEGEIAKTRTRFHDINAVLQRIEMSLGLVNDKLPAVVKSAQEFNNYKQRGIGVLMAASAAGAVIVEGVQYLVGRFTH